MKAAKKELGCHRQARQRSTCEIQWQERSRRIRAVVQRLPRYSREQEGRWGPTSRHWGWVAQIERRGCRSVSVMAGTRNIENRRDSDRSWEFHEFTLGSTKIVKYVEDHSSFRCLAFRHARAWSRFRVVSSFLVRFAQQLPGLPAQSLGTEGLQQDLWKLPSSTKPKRRRLCIPKRATW